MNIILYISIFIYIYTYQLQWIMSRALGAARQSWSEVLHGAKLQNAVKTRNLQAKCAVQ